MTIAECSCSKSALGDRAGHERTGRVVEDLGDHGVRLRDLLRAADDAARRVAPVAAVADRDVGDDDPALPQVLVAGDAHGDADVGRARVHEHVAAEPDRRARLVLGRRLGGGEELDLAHTGDGETLDLGLRGQAVPERACARGDLVRVLEQADVVDQRVEADGLRGGAVGGLRDRLAETGDLGRDPEPSRGSDGGGRGDQLGKPIEIEPEALAAVGHDQVGVCELGRASSS